ncbi:MAG TPA: lipoate--protein ligase family protein [Verrucomicrobiae bacterium]|nr:lipoate--protein ligase family protein [Verrucomicrobiae bacterium]
MKFFDRTFSTPAENLAADEALLDWREQYGGDEILRFWESPEPFVVVGYANKIATEVDADACEKNQVPILRRCSGGGTVLQGRGCLNYALILRIAENSPLANISSANQFIMDRNRAAIQTLLPAFETTPSVFHYSIISISGHTDLTIGDAKFSGNSQRRHKSFLLFHGTFLLNFNLALIEQCLKLPSLQPDYRHNRSHGEFVRNLSLPAAQVKAAMKKIWKAENELQNFPEVEIQRLAAEKYASRDWNFKF